MGHNSWESHTVPKYDSDILHEGLNNLSDDVDALKKRVAALETTINSLQNINSTINDTTSK